MLMCLQMHVYLLNGGTFAYYNVQTQVGKTHLGSIGFMHAPASVTHDI